MNQVNTLAKLLTVGALTMGGCSYTTHAPSSLAGLPQTLLDSKVTANEERQLQKISAYYTGLDKIAVAVSPESQQVYGAMVSNSLSSERNVDVMDNDRAHLMRFFGKDLVVFLDIGGRDLLEVKLPNYDLSEAREAAAFLTNVMKLAPRDIQFRKVSNTLNEKYGRYTFFVGTRPGIEASLEYTSARTYGFPHFIPSERIYQQATITLRGEEPQAVQRGVDFAEAIKQGYQASILMPGLVVFSLTDYFSRQIWASPNYPLKYLSTNATFPNELGNEKLFRELAEGQSDYTTAMAICIREDALYVACGTPRHRFPFSQRHTPLYFEGKKDCVSFTTDQRKGFDAPFLGDLEQATRKVTGQQEP